MGDLRSFFAAGKTAPIGNTRYPSGCGLTQRRHPAVPPDTQPSAFSIRTASSRAPTSSATPDTTSPPSAPGKSASSGNPATRRTSFAREIRLNWKISRPNSRSSSLPPARPSFHPAPVLSGFVPLRSPSPARFTPLSPRRNTCRASPLPPNGMPHEPRRGRPVQICKPDRMPRQKERQPAGAAALRQSDSGPIICC